MVDANPPPPRPTMTFPVAVRFEKSLVMNSSYGYELDVKRSRWPGHFRAKMHIFQFVSTIKAMLVDTMKQRTYKLCNFTCETLNK